MRASRRRTTSFSRMSLLLPPPSRPSAKQRGAVSSPSRACTPITSQRHSCSHVDRRVQGRQEGVHGREGQSGDLQEGLQPKIVHHTKRREGARHERRPRREPPSLLGLNPKRGRQVRLRRGERARVSVSVGGWVCIGWWRVHGDWSVSLFWRMRTARAHRRPAPVSCVMGVWMQVWRDQRPAAVCY